MRTGRITAIVLILLMTSGAMASLTVSSSYYSADAKVSSSLYGTDNDFQDGIDTANALAQVGGSLGNSTANASADLFKVTSMVSVALLPDSGGISSGTAASTGINALFKLISDTDWGFVVSVNSSANQSAGGLTNWMGLAILNEAGGSEIYRFTSPQDGDVVGKVFGPGEYDFTLAVSSYAEASVDPAGTFEFAEATAIVSAQVYAVPEPSTLLLLGAGGWVLRRCRL